MALSKIDTASIAADAVDNTILDLASDFAGIHLGGTAAANALEDYEEGTWTPTTPNGSWTVHEARYTKIGQLVTCVFWVQATATISADDFTGLPFTPAYESAGVVGYQNLNSATMAVLVQGSGVWTFRQGGNQYGLGNGDQARGMLTFITSA